MSLSDCPKCWNTPCTCGYMYKDWTAEALEEQIKTLQDVLDAKVIEIIEEECQKSDKHDDGFESWKYDK